MPPSASVSRPVTSALILPRSRNSGRSVRNAKAIPPPNARSTRMVMTVRCQFSQNSTPRPITRGDEAANELHEAGADEIPDAFGVGHDARDQHAGLRRIEVANRQVHHARLHALAHVGDRALRGDAEDLRRAQTRSRPERAWPHPPPARSASADPIGPPLTTSSMRYLDDAGQHEARQPADQHQRRARAPADGDGPRSARALRATRRRRDTLLLLRSVHRNWKCTTAEPFAGSATA